MNQKSRIALCLWASVLSACASGTTAGQPIGSNLYPVRGDDLVDLTMGFINGVVEGCVDSVEKGQRIAERYAGSDEFQLEVSPDARRAANLKDTDSVWRPKRGASRVTIIESADGCTVGANGPPLVETYANLSLVLKNARGFGDVEYGEGAAKFTRQTKTVGNRQLTVLLTGVPESASQISTLMATISWKE